MDFEEVFNSFGLKKTDNEVKEENDESSANTGTGFGKENSDEKKKTDGDVETRRELVLSGLTKKKR